MWKCYCNILTESTFVGRWSRKCLCLATECPRQFTKYFLWIVQIYLTRTGNYEGTRFNSPMWQFFPDLLTEIMCTTLYIYTFIKIHRGTGKWVKFKGQIWGKRNPSKEVQSDSISFDNHVDGSDFSVVNGFLRVNMIGMTSSLSASNDQKGLFHLLKFEMALRFYSNTVQFYNNTRTSSQPSQIPSQNWNNSSKTRKNIRKEKKIRPRTKKLNEQHFQCIGFNKRWGFLTVGKDFSILHQ